MLASASPLSGRQSAIVLFAALALSLSGAVTRPASLEKALVLAGIEGHAHRSPSARYRLPMT